MRWAPCSLISILHTKGGSVWNGSFCFYSCIFAGNYGHGGSILKISQSKEYQYIASKLHHLGETGSVYSGIDGLPKGRASDRIAEGCLVLEGGAFRGIYTSGVLDALMEADINLRCTVGVSAGAMNGVNYLSGQIGRSGRINLRYRHDSRYVGVEAVKANHGIIGFEFVLDELGDSFDQERFNQPERRFVAVATNMNTGKAEFFEKGKCVDIMRAVQASASMPFASAPVVVDGSPCLDGGCSEGIPLHWAMEQGYEKILVVRTRPADYRRDEHKGRTALISRMFSGHPDFADSLIASNERYNRVCDELEQLNAQGRILVISPSQPVSVHRLEGDMEKLGDLYYMGYHDGQNKIDAIRTYLEE